MGAEDEPIGSEVLNRADDLRQGKAARRGLQRNRKAAGPKERQRGGDDALDEDTIGRNSGLPRLKHELLDHAKWVTDGRRNQDRTAQLRSELQLSTKDELLPVVVVAQSEASHRDHRGMREVVRQSVQERLEPLPGGARRVYAEREERAEAVLPKAGQLDREQPIEMRQPIGCRRGTRTRKRPVVGTEQHLLDPEAGEGFEVNIAQAICVNMPVDEVLQNHSLTVTRGAQAAHPEGRKGLCQPFDASVSASVRFLLSSKHEKVEEAASL